MPYALVYILKVITVKFVIDYNICQLKNNRCCSNIMINDLLFYIWFEIYSSIQNDQKKCIFFYGCTGVPPTYPFDLN